MGPFSAAFRKFTVVAVLGSLLTPINVFAADRSESRKKLTFANIELSEQGVFVGQAVSSDGNGIPLLPIRLQTKDKQVVSMTDSSGFFRVAVPAGTTCLVRIGSDVYPCRVWKMGTAPPNALRRIAFVHDDSSVVRGNMTRKGDQCPANCDCDDCRRDPRASDKKYGLAVLALGATAAYFAFSRDASN